MNLTIDFGYSNATASWSEAYLALLFASHSDPRQLGSMAGSMAIADASRFVELFEMQVGVAPLDIGTYAEAIGGDNPTKSAVERSNEARSRGMFPLIIGDNRQLTELHSKDSLVALWGKVGRIETDETSLLNRHPSVLVGVRAATANAVQAIPSTTTILTAAAVIKNKEILKKTLSKMQDPVHLSIDLDVLAPSVAQTTRSLEPGGFGWYDLMECIELIFDGPGVVAADLVGTNAVKPRSPAALLGSQILLKIAGLLADGLDK